MKDRVFKSRIGFAGFHPTEDTPWMTNENLKSTSIPTKTVRQNFYWK